MPSEALDYGGTLFHGTSGSTNIRLLSTRLHVGDPGGGGMTLNLREAAPDLILGRNDIGGLWAVIANVNSTNSITVNGNPANLESWTLGPGKAALFRIDGVFSTFSTYVREREWDINTAMTANYDSGRGGLNETSSASASAVICGAYRLEDCDNPGTYKYSLDNINVYINRVVKINGDDDTCWLVTRIEYSDSHTYESITVDTVYVSCAACETEPPYDCNNCVAQYCESYAVVGTCAEADPADCPCGPDDIFSLGFYYDGAFRSESYFNTTYGAGAFCSVQSTPFVSSCEGSAATCTPCCWCFENAQYCDQGAATFGCTWECCTQGDDGVCTCLA